MFWSLLSFSWWCFSHAVPLSAFSLYFLFLSLSQYLLSLIPFHRFSSLLLKIRFVCFLLVPFLAVSLSLFPSLASSLLSSLLPRPSFLPWAFSFFLALTVVSPLLLALFLLSSFTLFASLIEAGLRRIQRRLSVFLEIKVKEFSFCRGVLKTGEASLKVSEANAALGKLGFLIEKGGCESIEIGIFGIKVFGLKMILKKKTKEEGGKRGNGGGRGGEEERTVALEDEGVDVELGQGQDILKTLIPFAVTLENASITLKHQEESLALEIRKLSLQKCRLPDQTHTFRGELSFDDVIISYQKEEEEVEEVFSCPGRHALGAEISVKGEVDFWFKVGDCQVQLTPKVVALILALAKGESQENPPVDNGSSPQQQKMKKQKAIRLRDGSVLGGLRVLVFDHYEGALEENQNHLEAALTEIKISQQSGRFPTATAKLLMEEHHHNADSTGLMFSNAEREGDNVESFTLTLGRSDNDPHWRLIISPFQIIVDPQICDRFKGFATWARPQPAPMKPKNKGQEQPVNSRPPKESPPPPYSHTLFTVECEQAVTTLMVPTRVSSDFEYPLGYSPSHKERLFIELRDLKVGVNKDGAKGAFETIEVLLSHKGQNEVLATLEGHIFALQMAKPSNFDVDWQTRLCTVDLTKLLFNLVVSLAGDLLHWTPRGVERRQAEVTEPSEDGKEPSKAGKNFRFSLASFSFSLSDVLNKDTLEFHCEKFGHSTFVGAQETHSCSEIKGDFDLRIKVKNDNDEETPYQLISRTGISRDSAKVHVDVRPLLTNIVLKGVTLSHLSDGNLRDKVQRLVYLTPTPSPSPASPVSEHPKATNLRVTLEDISILHRPDKTRESAVVFVRNLVFEKKPADMKVTVNDAKLFLHNDPERPRQKSILEMDEEPEKPSPGQNHWSSLDYVPVLVVAEIILEKKKDPSFHVTTDNLIVSLKADSLATLKQLAAGLQSKDPSPSKPKLRESNDDNPILDTSAIIIPLLNCEFKKITIDIFEGEAWEDVKSSHKPPKVGLETSSLTLKIGESPTSTRIEVIAADVVAKDRIFDDPPSYAISSVAPCDLIWVQTGDDVDLEFKFREVQVATKGPQDQTKPSITLKIFPSTIDFLTNFHLQYNNYLSYSPELEMDVKDEAPSSSDSPHFQVATFLGTKAIVSINFGLGEVVSNIHVFFMPVGFTKVAGWGPLVDQLGQNLTAQAKEQWRDLANQVPLVRPMGEALGLVLGEDWKNVTWVKELMISASQELIRRLPSSSEALGQQAAGGVSMTVAVAGWFVDAFTLAMARMIGNALPRQAEPQPLLREVDQKEPEQTGEEEKEKDKEEVKEEVKEEEKEGEKEPEKAAEEEEREETEWSKLDEADREEPEM